MKNNLLALFAFIFIFSFSKMGHSNVCDTLKGSQKQLAQKILDTQYVYSCCDETISKCIKKKSPCKLAIRLANAVCQRVKNGEDEQKIKRRLSKRAQSMNPYAKKYSIDTTSYPAAGEKTAPVTVVVYACARCPFCSKLIPQLHKTVTNGKLKNKVKLYFKPFPLKSHEFSKEAGLAMLAALELNKFWDYTLYLYSQFKGFCPKLLDDWAQKFGVDGKVFNQKMSESNTRKMLVQSKKEGLANGVNATPAIFINNRKYVGFLDIEELEDVLFEEFERIKK